MPEPTATDRAIAEGARVSTPEGAENLLAEFRAIQAELGGPEDEEVEAAQLGQVLEETTEKPAPTKGKDGRFVKGEKAPEKGKSGTEGTVNRAERAAFERQARRDAKAAVAAQESTLSQRAFQLQQREQAVAEMAKARQLFDAGDYDGAAKAAFGAASWNDLNDQAARAFASPEYRRVKALEKQTQDMAAERERERQASMTAQQQAREQKVLGDFHANLAETLPKAEDATVAALAEHDPSFVEAVFNRVVAAARQGEDLDPLEVAEEIVEHARAHFERVSKVFGGRPTSMVEATRVASPDRAGSKQQPVKPQKHVSRSTATETSAPPEFENDAEWVAFGTKALKRAHLEDEAAGRSSNQW